MGKKKFNYAVVRSIYGELWVGKTKLEVEDRIVFADIKDAVQKAEQLFYDKNIGFDPYLDEDDEDYDEELQTEYEDLTNETEDSVENIPKGVEKFIVR